MAWGYLINDYFDTETDRINKPGKNIFDGTMRKIGMFLMLGCFLGGILLPFGQWLNDSSFPSWLIFLNPVASILLWMYSRHLKSTVLVGNLLISALAVLLMAAPLGFIRDWESVTFESFFRWVIFASFSFSVTFIRELVKDAEDSEGDKVSGVNTLATERGISSALKAAGPQCLGVGVLLIFLFTFELTHRADLLRAYSYLVLAIVGFISGIAISAAKSKKQISTASLILKLWMGAGTISMWI